VKKTVIVMMMVMASGAMAEGISGRATIDAASAYVFRGSTFNDGFVLQPGAEVALGDLSVGTWANYDVDDYDGALDGRAFSEVDIYGSYTLPVHAVGLSIGYCVYAYPLDSTDADHEVSISAELDMVLAPSVSVNYGLDGGIEDAIYIELGIGHEFALCESVGAELGLAVGYLEPDEGDSGFTHANVSAGLSYKAFSATVTYVAQLDDDVLMDVADGGSYDTEVYGSLGVNVGF
jgi:hypothetical protein